MCYYCNKEFEVIKHHNESGKEEICTACCETAQRVYTAPKLSGLNDQPEYNYGLGCWVKNKEHRRELAKQMNLIEVGNETANTIHKHAESNKKESNYDA